MPLISCEAIYLLIWSQSSITANIPSRGKASFTITDQESIALVFSLSAEENTKLLQNSGFRVIVYWNKYISKVIRQTRKEYLDFLIDLSFQ